jgi:HlyD family secretion protein
VQDVATHTAGSVLAAGTVLLTLVPTDGSLEAEVWLAQDDVGFVAAGQAVQIKVATYPFQRHGLLPGHVRHIGADASHAAPADARPGATPQASAPGAYRTRIALDATALADAANGRARPLAPGMQVVAEVHLGTRSVFDYLWSPLARTAHDAGRER